MDYSICGCMSLLKTVSTGDCSLQQLDNFRFATNKVGSKSQCPLPYNTRKFGCNSTE